jgi:hypothetical protein
MGIGLALAVLLAASILFLARINPWFARRLARSSLAAGVLGLFCEIALLAVRRKREN